MKKKFHLLVAVLVAAFVLQSVPVHAQENRTKTQMEAVLNNNSADTGMMAVSSAAVTGSAVSSTSIGGNLAGADAQGSIGGQAGAGSAEDGAAGDGKAAVEDSKSSGASKDSEETSKDSEATSKDSEASKDKEASKDSKASKASAEEDKGAKAKKSTSKTSTAKKSASTESSKKAESKKSYTNSDLKLLACLIYAEAGNQPYKGKVAVGNVVMNRVKSSLFPKTLKEVIYQKGYSRSYGRYIYQFSVAAPSVGTLKKALNVYGKRTNAAEKKQEAECIKAAKAVLEGDTALDKKYLFFSRYSSWLAANNPNGVKISAHYFYK